MTGIVNTGSWGKALWPGINAWYGMSYNEFPVEYTDLFDTHTMNQHYAEDVGTSGMGLASVKEEGEGINYEGERQGFVTRYTPVEYALGFQITEIMMEDNLYAQVGEKRAKALGFSMRQTKEIVGANVYNNAFDSNYVGGDGVELGSSAHVNVAGGTWSNYTATDLSELALENACIAMGKWTNDRGLRIAVRPNSLIIPVDLTFEASRILDSDGRPFTADNEINAIKRSGKFAKGAVVNHYLTDTDAWFIRTDVQDGMKYMERRKDTFKMDEDFDTSNAKFKSAGRYAFGWTDPRAVYCSAGA